MQCDLCKQNEATMHLKHVVNGQVSELHVCEACAAEKGFLPPAEFSAADVLFGLGGQKDDGESPVSKKTCHVCGMSRTELRKVQRLGCAACYEVFAEELTPLLSAMHKGGCHVGKVPVGAKRAAEIEGLRTALAQAVAAQDFEEAATLRDKILAIEKVEDDGAA